MAAFTFWVPPWQGASNVAGLVEYVMRRTTDMRVAVFSVHDVEGPVRFDSSWIPGGRTQEVRHGLRVADLWTGLVSWPNASSARYFSVIVMDYHYLQTCKGLRNLAPNFETFVVGVLRVDQPGVHDVYELRTEVSETHWLPRGHTQVGETNGYEIVQRTQAGASP